MVQRHTQRGRLHKQSENTKPAWACVSFQTNNITNETISAPSTTVIAYTTHVTSLVIVFIVRIIVAVQAVYVRHGFLFRFCVCAADDLIFVLSNKKIFGEENEADVSWAPGSTTNLLELHSTPH